ncbi:MAG: ABC transporter ATP-binding protein [Oceanicoccus sp.]|uniref:ABC transporter ATP-binding protein n=1 Tax=Oceanicoccus sp. TaxID=2691044 RepID=UPI002639B1BE|nr:ABC transporter ATP-binding protein [Oceanicoccus sp.]MCP3908442.1 ABC transporter ATP-binding protein [Oceanicoccus sp.]MDG1772610.1 ABC transporter ATP-binding protein [Oceanicoccus sp.]
MLKVDSIQCHYGSQAVLDNVSFHVNEGDICCLLGPSGCGKTTALRAIAGFQPLANGSITLGDQLLSSSDFQLEPEQRQIGMVFQDYALFPHLTVGDNIRFGIQKLSELEQDKIVDSLLDLIKLENIAKRFPHELSGGQQQRVALARALAPNPRLLLLDEPFSNLDVDLRRHLNLEVRDILKEVGTSAILVTHDQEEAFAFGDHIGLLHEGRLQQWDTPFNLYHEPCNRFVANFIGQGGLLPGMSIDQHQIKTELGVITGNRAYDWPADTPVDVLLRPDDIVLNPDNGISSTVVKKVFSGSSTLYTLQLPTGSLVECLFPSHHDYKVGDTLNIQAEVEHLIAFGLQK